MKWLPATVDDACLPTVQTDPARRGAATFRYVDIAGIDRDAKTISRADELPCSEAPSRARKLIHASDVLVSTVRPNLNAVAIVPDELDGEIASTGFSVLRANPDVLNPRFLFYWVQSGEFLDYLVANATGASYPAVTDGVVRRARLPLPTPSEQARIVELLDEADRLRRLRREADAKAARILPALFLKMFGDPATNPMGWPVEPLTKICNPKQWPTISAKELTESGYPVYGANGKIGFYSTYNHEFPTVLITCRGATSGTINVCEPKSYVTGNAMALDDPDTKKTSIEFLETYLNVRGLADTITGAAQPQITRQNLQPVTVFVPPLSFVERFSRQAQVIKKLMGGAEIGSRRLGGLFELLLQQAFSGQLTAKWREAHMKELLAEMEQQARLLNLPLPVEREVLA